MRRVLAGLIVVAISGCTSPGATPIASPSAVVALPTTVPTKAPPTSEPTPAGPIPRGGLLFSWYANGPGKSAFVMWRDGSNQRRILSEIVGDIRSMGWRPDGDLMTFVVRDSTHPDGAIWSAAPDGSGAAMLYDGLADGCTSVFHPVWAPDGKKLSIVCYVDQGSTHTSTLAVLEVASKRLTKLVTYPWPDFLDNPARWSHDGTRIAYDVLHWDPTNTFLDGSRIATIEVMSASKPHVLTDLSSFGATPAWSPDDSMLIYNSYDFGNMVDAAVSDLYAMRPDGSDMKPFLTAADAGVARIAHAVWDPTGTRIWVAVRIGSDTYHIAWLDPTTKALTQLPTVGAGAEVRP